MDINQKYLNQLAFFGITPENAPIARINLYNQIHEIVFHGKGGYDWDTVYKMPRWLRQFTFNKLNTYYEKENEAHENSSKPKTSNTLIDPSGKVNKENWNSVVSPKTIKSGPKTKYK